MKSKYLYLIVFYFTLTTSFIGVFLYPSFLSNHFRISPTFIYLVYVVLSLLDKIYRPDNKYKIVSRSWLIVFFVIYFILNFAESLTYDNFIFSKLHINPKEFIYPLFVVGIEFVFSLNVKNAKDTIKSAILRVLNYKTLVLMFVILILLTNLLGIISKMKQDIQFMSKNIRASISAKYEFKLGSLFYKYSRFIINNTESGSKILTPPFPAYPWPQTGNTVYFRYFLYPRTLSSGDEYEPKYNIDEFDYILIAWGETPTTSGSYTHGWPKFDVKADYVLLMTDDSLPTKIEGDYIYNNYKDKEVWGIIKIKK